MRSLTAREIATIRAALRLWIDTPPAFVEASLHAEFMPAGGFERDDAIEALIRELGTAPAVTLATTTAIHTAAADQ